MLLWSTRQRADGPEADCSLACRCTARNPKASHWFGTRPALRQIEPILAGRILGVLLEEDNNKLLRLLDSEQELEESVERVLQTLDFDPSDRATRKSAGRRVDSGGANSPQHKLGDALKKHEDDWGEAVAELNLGTDECNVATSSTRSSESKRDKAIACGNKRKDMKAIGTVTSGQVRDIIGLKGANIKKILDKCGVHINISKADEREMMADA